ncbi:hypothetical protein P7K49_015698 [Saguinus oedipus]|uniref:Uncharacterized protein n=1 Tax=Saguinus oedipus TaxID=9490 RepID=A0ABQ9V9Z0_SAGOE|nr:hypothetical protein P7K49_015698 [Saguinus oedipus]
MQDSYREFADLREQASRLSLKDATTSVSCCKQRNNVCARAGFMSKTQRGSLAFAGKGPPPGDRKADDGPRHYNINESLVKQSPNMLMSCFKSKTNRGLKVTSTGPGPGYYNPSDGTKVPKKTLFPAGHWEGWPGGTNHYIHLSPSREIRQAVGAIATVDQKSRQSREADNIRQQALQSSSSVLEAPVNRTPPLQPASSGNSLEAVEKHAAKCWVRWLPGCVAMPSRGALFPQGSAWCCMSGASRARWLSLLLGAAFRLTLPSTEAQYSAVFLTLDLHPGVDRKQVKDLGITGGWKVEGSLGAQPPSPCALEEALGVRQEEAALLLCGRESSMIPVTSAEVSDNPVEL